MPVMVFKPGNQATVRGVSVDFERIRPQSLDAYLNSGWYKTTEECKHALQEEENAVTKPEAEDEVDIYSLTLANLKSYAKAIGMKIGHNTPKAELQKMVAEYGTTQP
jgi:hypothetical protein